MEASLIVIVGAAAVWMAHAYSKLIGERLRLGHPLTSEGFVHAARATWPIVSAGVLLSLPFLPTGLGAYEVATGLRLSTGLGVVLLALIGFMLGVVTDSSWGRRLVLIAFSAGLGVVIVLAEIAIHH